MLKRIGVLILMLAAVAASHAAYVVLFRFLGRYPDAVAMVVVLSAICGGTLIALSSIIKARDGIKANQKRTAILSILGYRLFLLSVATPGIYGLLN